MLDVGRSAGGRYLVSLNLGCWDAIYVMYLFHGGPCCVVCFGALWSRICHDLIALVLIVTG